MNAVMEFLDRHLIALSIVLGIILAVVVKRRSSSQTAPSSGNNGSDNSYEKVRAYFACVVPCSLREVRIRFPSKRRALLYASSDHFFRQL